jgi:predicted permease
MTRLYRLLLLLYPSGFRREYGDEMTAIFAERAARAGAIRRLGLLLGAIPEIAGNAIPMHGEMLAQDLRWTARTLRRAPGFALTAILVTAIGIGANTAAFSVADFVLLRPLAFPESDRLARLCEGPRTGPTGWGCMNQLSPANYRDFKEQTTSFEALGAYLRDARNLVGGGEPQRVSATMVEHEVLPLLGVRPHVGRVFDEQDVAGAPGTVVIGYGLWESRFGGDPAVLGTTVNLDGLSYEVVGVMPRDFHFPTRDAQLWIPFRFPEEAYENRGDSYVEAVGRLAPGVSFERARADLAAVAERLARQFPETNGESGVSFFRMRDEFSPRYRLMLQALCGASLCILLLACANLANLLLVRASARERELSVRAALGAGKERLVRQMVTESLLLALVGGALGVVISLLVFPVLSLLVPATLPLGTAPELNLRLLALAALFTTLTGLGFGLVPALRAGGAAGSETLRSGRGGGRKRRTRGILVGVEVAGSVVLLVSSGLLIRAMLRVQAIDPGFRAEGVVTLQTILPRPKYDSAGARQQFYDQVLTEVRRLPEVEAAGFISGLPMVMIGNVGTVTLPGQQPGPGFQSLVSRRYVTPGYFRAMGIPLLAGRDLSGADVNDRARVAVVSESFVERYWPEGNPLGRPFMFFGEEWSVIGVVGNVRVRGLERGNNEPQLYAPATLVAGGRAYDPKSLVIRTSGPETAILPAVREIVRAADPDQPISDVMSLTDLVGTQTADRRAQVDLLGALAAIAVLLAGLGINGLLAYTVAQRRQEIAVRLALGAEPGGIARAVVRDGVALVALGLVPGLLVAWMAGRYLSALLFGVPPADPTTIVATIGLCLLTALVGASLPALRAVRVSPMSVMRTE